MWGFKSSEEIAAEAASERAEAERIEAVEEHNRGQREGAESSLSDRLVHNTIGNLVHSEEFNNGYDNATRGKLL